MKTTVFGLLCMLAACGGTTPVGDPAPLVADDCPLRIDEVCKNGSCEIMGTTYPAQLSGWCSPTQSPPVSFGDATPSCNGWKSATVLDGDQGIEFFYDATGAPIAIMRWESAPPCEGACKLSCVAGPVNLSPTTLAQCVTDNDFSECPPD